MFIVLSSYVYFELDIPYSFSTGLGPKDIAGISTLFICGIVGMGLAAFSVYQHYFSKNSARAKAHAEQTKGFDNVNYESRDDNDLQGVKVEQSPTPETSEDSSQTEQRYWNLQLNGTKLARPLTSQNRDVEE